MADPRLTTGLDGYRDKRATFPHDGTITYDATKAGGSAQVNMAVTIDDTSRTTSLVGDEEGVLGQLKKVESDGLCIVQTHGYMKLPTGTEPGLVLMNSIVGLAGGSEGYVGATDAIGEAYVQRGMILDTTETTVLINGSDVDAVEVLL